MSQLDHAGFEHCGSWEPGNVTRTRASSDAKRLNKSDRDLVFVEALLLFICQEANMLVYAGRWNNGVWAPLTRLGKGAGCSRSGKRNMCFVEGKRKWHMGKGLAFARDTRLISL